LYHNKVAAAARCVNIYASGLASVRKELVWWDDTGHQMLVEGPHRAEVYARIEAFVAGLTPL
jgi:alpha-beta hydrolase superfamily lysophospholipase